MRISASIARRGWVEGGCADNHPAQARAAGRPTQGVGYAGTAQFKLRTRAIGGGCGGDGRDHAAGGLRVIGAGVIRQRRRALASQIAKGFGTGCRTGGGAVGESRQGGGIGGAGGHVQGLHAVGKLRDLAAVGGVIPIAGDHQIPRRNGDGGAGGSVGNGAV